MSSGKPMKVKVEYEDGSCLECEFSRVSQAGQKELADLGLVPLPGGDAAGQEKFVLLEWKDGWKEVYALPPDVSDVRKYYVIRRVEEVGRLFLDRGDGYPELIEVLRKPKEVERMTLL
jgi:hypothetical protein